LVAHRAAANREMNLRSTWLFPSDSKSMHVAEVQQPELGSLTGHGLRHAYASLALQAGVPLLELKFMMNHSASSGGVTMDYTHP
ncbi:MAG TPA: integrase, partial [Xylella sp.]